MGRFTNSAARFWSELRRRKTFGTAVGYLIVLAAVVGPVSDILSGLGAPQWILQGIIITLLIGFPVVLVLSWLFDFSLQGIERTEDLEPEETEPDPQPVATVESFDGPSVEIETGTAHRYQVTLLRISFVLTNKGVVVDDPEELLRLVPEVESLVNALAEKYSAVATNSNSTSYEYIFGYPTAYENDAIRAVVMALAVAEDLQRLGGDVMGSSPLRLASTAGVHSDLVVIDQSADVMNVIGSASLDTNWVQSLAAPGAVMLDDFTHQLLRNRIVCESAGSHTNARSGAVCPLYSALELHQPELAPETYDQLESVFLGRSSEIALIFDRWQRALEGEDEFIVLRGEPGIGKTTIVREFTQQARESESVLIMPLYCSPLERNSAFQPIIEFIMGQDLGLGLSRSRSAAEKTDRIKNVLKDLQIDVEKAVPLVASLLSFESDKETSFSETARQELMQYLVDFLRATARNKTLLFIVEDLHWADASTLEIINLLVGEKSESGMMSLFTTRPSLHLEWESRSNVTTLNLQKLSRRSTRELVGNILHELNPPEDFIKRLVEEAGGNPMFAEELAKAIYETAKSNPDYKVSELVLPVSLQRSLASRVDNLGAAKPLLQLCSLLGREFDYQLLTSVSYTRDEGTLQDELRLLVNAEFLYQRGSIPACTFSFKHALVQETAYQSMLKSTRKDLHARVAAALEKAPGQVYSVPEVLAYHYEGSLQFDAAIACLTAAAKSALVKYAMAEAVGLADSGLRVIASMPDSSARDIAEVELQAIRGRALLTANGYAEPEVERTFKRALELCDRVGDIPKLFTLLCGLWSYFQIGGSVSDARDVGERLMRIADGEDSPAKKVQAHYCLGYSSQRAGQLTTALEHLEAAQLITQTNQADYCEFSPSGDDGRIHNLAVAAHINWHLGNSDTALELSQDAIKLAYQLKNPAGIAFALFLSTWLMQKSLDYNQTLEMGNKTVALATEKQLNFWIANSEYIMSWARFHAHRDEHGSGPEQEIDNMLNFMHQFRQSGARFGAPAMCLDTAEALALNNRIEEAEKLVQEARDLITNTGECYVNSEPVRVEATIAKIKGETERAITLYREAISIAEASGSLAYRSHAASDLALLLQEQGKGEQAAEALPGWNAT